MHMTPAGIVGIVAMDNTSVLGKTHTYVLARLSLAFDRLFNGAGIATSLNRLTIRTTRVVDLCILRILHVLEYVV